MAQCDECGAPVRHNLGCKIWHRENIAKIDEYTGALKFIADLAGEELAYAKVGTGAEVALRHIQRKARDAIQNG